MPERQTSAINPEYLRACKDTIRGAWQHLPPEHQATMALVLLGDVLGGDYGPWLREAITLIDYDPQETTTPETLSTPSTLRPEHFRDLPLPFQPEAESGAALARARLTLPGSTRVWYPSAFDGRDLFFGLVVELELACDYFSLDDLAQLRGEDDQPVQLDTGFTPRSLNDLIAHHAQGMEPPSGNS